MPSLAERAEDLPALAQNIMDRLTDEWGRDPVQFTRAALLVLQKHSWPGNIRELRNVLERALLAVADSPIDAGDLDFAGSPRGGGAPAVGEAEFADTRLTLREVEINHIARVLREEGGHVERTAKRLDIPRSTLYQKIKAYGLEPSRPGRE
jgi:DNA-binding NtrC family response regulator